MGDDNEGFEGFLPEDIQKAVELSINIKCIRCNRKGANLKCSRTRCKNYYHTNCALKDDVNFQFTGEYPIYCNEHFSKNVEMLRKHKRNESCMICSEPILIDQKSIMFPCCKNGYFHHRCIQKYALTSGSHHFKCPLCSNREVCMKKLEKAGIYIPIRDALWELEENGFQGLNTELDLHCEKCESDRDSDKAHLWAMCNVCGSNGIHYSCNLTSKQEISMDYTCSECVETIDKLEKEKSRQKLEKYKKTLLQQSPRKIKRIRKHIQTKSKDNESSKIQSIQRISESNVLDTQSTSKRSRLDLPSTIDDVSTAGSSLSSDDDDYCFGPLYVADRRLKHRKRKFQKRTNSSNIPQKRVKLLDDSDSDDFFKEVKMRYEEKVGMQKKRVTKLPSLDSDSS